MIKHVYDIECPRCHRTRKVNLEMVVEADHQKVLDECAKDWCMTCVLETISIVCLNFGEAVGMAADMIKDQPYTTRPLYPRSKTLPSRSPKTQKKSGPRSGRGQSE